MPGIRLLYVARRRNPQQAHSAGSETKRPGDTLKAYAKAMDLIAKLKAGADFDSLAMAESEDPTVESNRGDLYFFTGGQMVMPFENGAWVMKVNETSSIPIHTSFGYHLKITQRQRPRDRSRSGTSWPSQNRRRRTPPTPQPPSDGSAPGRTAWRRGSTWRVRRAVSEDQGSASRGGDLSWFERKRYVQPFDEAAFLLKPGGSPDRENPV